MNAIAQTSLAALALAFATAAAPVSAEDSLPTRAVTAVGIVIAAQGDMALIEIRDELRRNLLKALKPILPSPSAPTQRAPATATGPR